MSVPTRVAVSVLLTLLLCTIIVFATTVDGSPLQGFLSDHIPEAIAVLVLLMVLIPFAAWKLATVWLYSVRVRFVEIEQAWNRGLQTLAEHGLSLTSAPVFLVLGPKDASEGRALIESSEIPMEMTGMPEGNPPILWFANSTAIFLVCPGASQVSLLSGASPENRLVQQAQLDEASAKLACVCELLRRHRLPYCAVNGIMSFLPQQLITLSDECAAALEQAAAADARLLRKSLGLRAPIVVLVGGMEKESGFRELVRRFGKEIALHNRVGKGNIELWNDPTPELLEALGRHAACAFEDNIYPLFRSDSDLTEIGNTKLYNLLCLSRLRINNRLSVLLRNAYASEAEDLPYSLPFVGCYFAATGDREDRRAFAASVFDRLVNQLNELDWHPEVRAAEERFFLFRDIILCLNAILLIAICVLAWRLISG